MTDTTQEHIDTESTYHIDWSRTSEDYARHRIGFPDRFFEVLRVRGLLTPETRAVDLGCGTGAVALGLARRGAEVAGVDIAEGQLAQARSAADAAGLEARFSNAPAEATGLPSGAFDFVVAGQCWHWFDRPRAAAEARRLLRPGGALVIGQHDWLERPGNVVDATLTLVRSHRRITLPHLDELAIRALYPYWLDDLHEAGFEALESLSFDVEVPYDRDGWRGRMRASACVGASMEPAGVARFDAALGAMLAERFAPSLSIPHRVFMAFGTTPAREG